MKEEHKKPVTGSDKRKKIQDINKPHEKGRDPWYDLLFGTPPEKDRKKTGPEKKTKRSDNEPPPPFTWI